VTIFYTASDGGTGVGVLVEELSIARDRIDRATELLQWSFDLREQLTWQFDIDDARSMVDAYKRAVAAHLRGNS
jgi:hypothetical protein